jgi:hypothetical protein
MNSGRKVPAFREPAASIVRVEEVAADSSQSQYLSIRLHDITAQKTVSFTFTAIRT